MSNKKFSCVKSIVNRLKSLFSSSRILCRRRAVPKPENQTNGYNVLSVSPEVSEKSLSDEENVTRKDTKISEVREASGRETRETTDQKSFSISNEVSPGCVQKVFAERKPFGGYSMTTVSEAIPENSFKRVKCDSNKLEMAPQVISSTSGSRNGQEPQVEGVHYEERNSSNNQQYSSDVTNTNERRGAKKLRRRRKALPEAVHKLKSGFLVATNHIAEKMSTGKDRVCVNVDEPFTCKKTFKKCKTKPAPKSKDWRSTPKREPKISFDTGSIIAHDERQQQAKDRVKYHAENQRNERFVQYPPKSIESRLPNPILDYTFLSMDFFYTVIEQLHDNMDLVRNGIQQLIDNFTQPSIMRLQDQENRMLQFKQSVEMLMQNIERMNYAMINLPERVSNMRYLLLPCKNTIREFNDHIQKMSIDFEHTQYFNNDSPMHTLLKMIVIIKILNTVLGRGRRAFIRSVDFQYTSIEEHGIDFDVTCYHERFIRPTFDMLFRRTEAMVKLRNFSVILSQRWVVNQDWDSFLPSLQEFMKLVKMVEPFLAVPQDWYAIRILPETRIMHVFDGFMSEFYRAIVTPGFANSNPVAFGSIFTVIQFILDNIINQHVIILRDLNTGLNLQESGSAGNGIMAGTGNFLGNNNLNGVYRQNLPLYENVNHYNNVSNNISNGSYQNI